VATKVRGIGAGGNAALHHRAERPTLNGEITMGANRTGANRTIRLVKRGVMIAAAALFLLSAPADAASVQLSAGLTQQGFEDFSREMGVATSYLTVTPAAPLGLLGFNAGLETTLVDIREDRSFWKSALKGDAPNYLFVPKLRVQKGLPGGVDVGAVYSRISQIDTTLVGGEVKWAVLPGGAVTPAVAVRGSYTKLSGANDVDLQTYGADISISKGFVFVTPYAGIGQVWIRGEENSPLVALKPTRISQVKSYAGVKVDFLIVHLVAEVQYAEIPVYTTRLNVGF